MRRWLARLGLAALFLAALAGAALSAAFLLVSTEAGRSLLVPRLVALANGEIQGRIELEGFSVGSTGALELRGLRLLDPQGRPVAEVRRARGQVDLSRLRSRRVSLRLEVDGAALLLAREPGGPWSLASALAPAHPAGPPGPRRGPFPWTIRLARLALRGGEVEVREGAEVRARARDLSLEARAIYGPRGGRAELQLAGRLLAPAERPLSLQLVAGAAGDRVSVPQLRAALGDAALELVAEGVPAERRGRVAVLALSLPGEDAGLLAPAARPRGLSARAFAESDGSLATAWLEARPAGPGGSGDAALALRLPPGELAAGLDLRLDGLDPSRLTGLLPPGDLRLTARGRAAGPDLRRLRGQVRLSAAPSRLGGGRFGPAEVEARVGDGSVEVQRLEAAVPGATVAGRGAWRARGPVSGSLVADAADLEAFARNLSGLAGVRLPRLAGSGRLEARLAGTAEAPEARLVLSAPRLEVEAASAREVALEAEVAGPSRAPRLRVEARAARLAANGIEARSLSASLGLAGSEAEVRLAAVLPQAGSDPFALRGSGLVSPDRRSLAVRRLSLAWPGTRFDLGAPARVDLAGPRVDRLELESGGQRLALEGGLARGALDVRASAERLELDRIPPSLLPEGLGLAGRLSFAAEAHGRPAAPSGTAHVELAGLAARGLSGIDAAADLRLDGSARRASGSLAVHGLAGGALSATADLPLALRRARPSEPVSFHAEVADLDVAAALEAAGADLPLAGRLSGRADLGGTVGSPALAATAALEQGRWGQAAAGRLSATARLAGSLSAPRGRVELAVADASAGGWRELALEAEAAAAAGAVDLSLRARAAGRDVLSARGQLSLPPEELLDRRAVLGAPLRLSVEASGVDLSRLRGPAELAGAVDLRAAVSGRLRAPSVDLEADARGLALSGRPLGDLTARGRAGGRQVDAGISLRAAGGGGAEASLEAAAEVSAEALARGSWREAPARATFRAERLDLSLLSAAAPDLLRSASGVLDARLEASGPLARLRPTGTVRLAAGRAGIPGAGDWHDIQLAATLSPDEVRLERLEARRGQGSLQATASLRGLERPGPAELRGELRASRLTISQYGQDLATLDLAADVRGTVADRAVSAELTVPSGRAVLPDRSLRTLQSLEPRPDILLQRRGARPPRADAGAPWRASVRLVLPGHFEVTRRDPRVDAELRGDVTATVDGGAVRAEGRAELVRGTLDLYGNGRTFDLRRASTTFGGGPVGEGLVEGEAVAQFPDHLVKVTLGGKVDAPTVKLTSEPPLDEGRIAMLIATGRTEGRAGAGAAGMLTGEQAGYAVLGVFATRLLRDALQDKLPVDSVALEPGQIRAGKYLSEKVYLDYVHRSAANPEQGENANEVRVEYQVSPRWTLESRYGDANAGSASLIWSKDY